MNLFDTHPRFAPLCGLLIALLALAGPAAAEEPAGEPTATVDEPGYERALLDTLRLIERGERGPALAGAEALARRYPSSKMAAMLLADLGHAGPATRGGVAFDRADAGLRRDLQFDIEQRLAHRASPAYRGFYPRAVLFVAEDQPYVIVTDQRRSRIYVYRNRPDALELVADFFVTIGLNGIGKERRGDKKTPVGIYHVTRYIDGAELPDLYGAGAFPISYPNAWDRRRQRTGDGIWIHGTPSDTYNRAPRASDGCIVVSNPDFGAIDRYILADRATPVVVTDEIEWISREQWQAERDAVRTLLSTWLTDWQSLDHDSYRRHYSQTELDAYGRDFDAWDEYKRWVNRAKTWIEVGYRRLNVFNYPGERDLLLMQFEQSYRSNNHNVESSKELYWRKRDAHWRIVYEGERRLPRIPGTMAEN